MIINVYLQEKKCNKCITVTLQEVLVTHTHGKDGAVSSSVAVCITSL